VTPSGDVKLLTSELAFPNGIAFSPDEKTLYVSNATLEKPIWMAYDVAADGTPVARPRFLRRHTPRQTSRIDRVYPTACASTFTATSSRRDSAA
jgi:sugar lactone lactonase YvrE